MATELINKIIRVIDLAQSDARDKSIEGVVEYILCSVNEACTLVELGGYIKSGLDFEIHETELTTSVEHLKNTGAIEPADKGKFLISAKRKLELDQLFLKAKEKEEKRFERFKDVIDEIENDVTEELKEEIWAEFTAYLYECYLEYGRSVIYAFRPDKQEKDGHKEMDVKVILKKYLVKFDSPEDAEVFKKYVEAFPDHVTSDELGYLVSLANKAESFFSLGLSREDYKEALAEITFDWTVFTDTNFLYSILDLHSHPENAAAKAVVILGTELGIKFKYLPETLKELQHKRNDFVKTLGKQMTRVQVSALVKSEKLDNFMQRYLERKLQDWDNTPHPSDIINHAQIGLRERNVTVYSSNLEGLKKRETFLLNQESKYNDYLRMLDELRVERGLPSRFKDPGKVYHDIIFREAIIYHREGKADTFSDVKHFGITLDQTLLKFDRNENKKAPTGFVIPTFFEPSTLLQKLLKYSPLEADDYKRAFISTISTPALDENIHSSRVALRSSEYFINMGIKDEKLMVDCLRDETFLDKFRDLEESPDKLKEYVESVFSKQYTELEGQREKLQNEIAAKGSEIGAELEISSEREKENVRLGKRVGDMEEQMKMYDTAIKQMKRQHDKVLKSTPSGQITLDDGVLSQKNEELESEGKQKDEKITKLEGVLGEKKLLGKARWSLFWTCLVGVTILAAYGFLTHEYGEGINLFQKIINSWPMLAGCVILSIFLGGIIIGKQKLIRLGWPFTKIFKSEK